MRRNGLTAQLLHSAEEQREAIVSLCAELVAAPSVNPDGDTRAVADVVSRALNAREICSRQEHLVPSMPSVVAEIDSGRPGPHLVLNVHLDTMPPGDESTWTQPVWELTRTDGRLYGLGMGNMKGAVAAMITAAALLSEHRDSWCGRITFTAVSDEVVFGDNGAAYLLREHPDLLGDALICGEGPGFRRLALGEKGVLWVAVTADGPAGHSSAVQRGHSASARIAQAVAQIDDLTGLTGSLPPELAAMATSGDDPDPGLVLTANVGTVSAGTFVGQMATAATAEVDLRLPPGITAEDALALVESTVKDIESVRVRRLKGWDANWTAPEAPLTRAWNVASRAVIDAPPTYAIRLPASDASRWRRQGVQALCYGPQPTWSAGIDDYADEDEVVRCAALYALTAVEYLRAP
ncbi:acetylornithine deacetylase or succinyl-diaminopimelate desuccinylase [Mycolicibacterium aurum]|uniref:Acetylornithine deacetylase or succinyl-diaminopimelate desuccinylase n=1 Tax=Mycolicibacterium aurum TaxID=1791 RepID=A0A3S4S2W8_MYCAU|nr:M20/M25/M40 family metallo-hydrolase [Mycolicibacterium aurum]VEG55034.1 acetylornithine deacetylase or succinyl-diaminopimelate desuccinylase [Mycolicibacterium aurum]